MPVESALRELEQRAAELQDSGEEFFRVMADAAPIMIWMAGTDTLCTFVNRAFLAFSGRTMQQELGHGWAEGVHPMDVMRCSQTYLTAFLARRPFQTQFRLRRHDGEYLWTLDSGVPFYSRDGVFAGFIGSGIGIHDWIMASTPEPAGRVPLSEQEKRVLVLIANGKSTKQVAAALGISFKTADSYRSKIMEKLDIHDTATLVRYAVRNQLVEP